ncbi:MAG: glycosyltransferase [Bacteroidales bacterium]|nr:glycosyltransferase [Bacteroidales bacterium]
MKIALLIPCYNEEKTIEKVIRDFRKELPDADIYVYDNNSTDNTYQIALDNGAIVRKERKQGKANVVRSMFRTINSDIYIMVDGDDTYPASEVKKLMEPALSEDADMVIGDRLTNGTYSKENKRGFHEFGNNLVRVLINRLFKAKMKDIMTGYRVFSKRFVKNYPVLCSGFELETEMTVYALNNKYNLVEIPIEFRDRPAGSISKLRTFTDGRKVIITIFNLYRHYRPFVFFGFIAIIMFLLALVFGIPVIREYILYQYVYKVPSAILASSLIIVSLFSFSIGLILDTISIIDRKNNELRIMNNSQK